MATRPHWNTACRLSGIAYQINFQLQKLTKQSGDRLTSN